MKLLPAPHQRVKVLQGELQNYSSFRVANLNQKDFPPRRKKRPASCGSEALSFQLSMGGVTLSKAERNHEFLLHLEPKSEEKPAPGDFRKKEGCSRGESRNSLRGRRQAGGVASETGPALPAERLGQMGSGFSSTAAPQ